MSEQPEYIITISKGTRAKTVLIDSTTSPELLLIARILWMQRRDK